MFQEIVKDCGNDKNYWRQHWRSELKNWWRLFLWINSWMFWTWVASMDDSIAFFIPLCELAPSHNSFIFIVSMVSAISALALVRYIVDIFSCASLLLGVTGRNEFWFKTLGVWIFTGNWFCPSLFYYPILRCLAKLYQIYFPKLAGNVKILHVQPLLFN